MSFKTSLLLLMSTAVAEHFSDGVTISFLLMGIVLAASCMAAVMKNAVCIKILEKVHAENKQINM